ncbi:10 TM acyl transferase domain found in Cas1p-domain-containing protein [Xylariomycetidae sp. FL2044]|nr:10 TM acyl transferase domain found in Cas1p-domain-containing protein [Xylariomycetidae sp. FL2044]
MFPYWRDSWHLCGDVAWTLFLFTYVGLYYIRFDLVSDPYRCRALLHNGTWSPAELGKAKRWEPTGCLMAHFSKKNMRQCVSGQTLVFAGDSTIRQIFWAAAKRLDPIGAKERLDELWKNGQQHDDYLFKYHDVDLQFIWDPWLNSTSLQAELKGFATTEEKARGSTDHDIALLTSPALIIMGSPGYWAARYGEDDYLSLFQSGIDNVTEYMSINIDEGIHHLVSKKERNVNNTNQVLLAPVYVPEYNDLSPERKVITPERVRTMNEYLLSLSTDISSHILWTFNEMAKGSGEAFLGDGIHWADNIAEAQLDVVLNSICNKGNSVLVSRQRATCCVATDSVHDPTMGIKIMVLWILTFILNATLVLVPVQPPIVVDRHFFFRAIVGVVIACWIYDRTTFMPKIERHFNPDFFNWSCLAWLAVSLLSLRMQRGRSRPTGRASPPPTKHRETEAANPDNLHDEGFLSRNQTDEIKGIMQGFILLYHYHYASQVLWVYRIIRLFISMYFFLSAYGHTMYLLETGDFSNNRLGKNFFRINFLSSTLPFVMFTNYSTYYFPSAVSFWYLSVHLLLYFNQPFIHDIRAMAPRVVLWAVGTTVIVGQPGLLETVNRLTHPYFGMVWNVKELRFRLVLDMFIPYIGVMAAIVVRSRSLRHGGRAAGEDRNPNANPSRRVAHHPAFPAYLYYLSPPVLALFFLLTRQSDRLPDKQHYNTLHTLVSWVPVVAFLLLRNATRRLRNAHLALPARLGRIALETYVLQYHVWLGADATARQSWGLADRWGWGPAGRALEACLVAAMFLQLAGRFHSELGAYLRHANGEVFYRLLCLMWITNGIVLQWGKGGKW